MCRCKKEKNLILKKYPTFFPCKSQPKEKSPGKSWQISPQKFLKKNDNLHVFFFFTPELPDIPGPAEISAKRQEKRSFENASSSYDPRASLFSTLDAKLSAVLHLNPPKKRTKLSDTTFSSGEEDEVMGNIHPSNKSKTTFLLEDTNFDPGSPLDRSTPISEYESEETEAFSINEKTENITPKNNNIISTHSTTVGCTSTAVSSNIPETSTSNQELISEIQPSTSRNDKVRGKTSPPVNSVKKIKGATHKHDDHGDVDQATPSMPL